MNALQTVRAQGTTIPPIIKTKLLASALDKVDADGIGVPPTIGKGQGIRNGFLNAINSCKESPPSSTSFSVPLLSPLPPGEVPSFDEADEASKHYRLAMRIAARYNVSASELEYSGKWSARLRVFAGQTAIWTPFAVPDHATVDSAIVDPPVSPADDQMYFQQFSPEVFMWWAAVEGGNGKAENFGKTFEALDTAMAILSMPLYEAKARAGVWRPSKVKGNKPAWKPSLDEPRHSSWPAGHAFAGGALTIFFLTLKPSLVGIRLWRAAWLKIGRAHV